jgi:GH15 family glucan-1,4-alpha-glucosidase
LAESAAIREATETHGYDRELDSYVGVFESRTLDASLLLMARSGYLEAAHPRMRATYRRLEQRLGCDSLLCRFAEVDADRARPKARSGCAASGPWTISRACGWAR